MASTLPNGVRGRKIPFPALKRTPDSKQSDVGSTMRQSMSGGGHNGNVRALDAMGSTRNMLQTALSALVSWGIIVGLIFGGCCSNVCNI